jgi:hypothetical protein
MRFDPQRDINLDWAKRRSQFLRLCAATTTALPAQTLLHYSTFAGTLVWNNQRMAGDWALARVTDAGRSSKSPQSAL